MNQKGVILYSGLSWMVIGIFLFTLGLNLLVKAGQNELGVYPWLGFLAPYSGGLQNAAIILISGALIVGYFKAKGVLSKTAQKNISRLQALPQPIKWSKVHSPFYIVLIVVMMSMGMLFNVIGLSPDIRGFIDVAVGSALINGSMTYFKSWSCAPATK